MRRCLSLARAIAGVSSHYSIWLACRKSFINCPHDLLSPANGVGDCGNRRRHALPTVVLSQLPSGKDAGGDQQHALPTFVHAENLADSPFVRLRDMLFQPVLD
jgi:hypothetical protein